jgi:hypothetical protein
MVKAVYKTYELTTFSFDCCSMLTEVSGWQRLLGVIVLLFRPQLGTWLLLAFTPRFTTSLCPRLYHRAGVLPTNRLGTTLLSHRDDHDFLPLIHLPTNLPGASLHSASPYNLQQQLNILG